MAPPIHHCHRQAQRLQEPLAASAAGALPREPASCAKQMPNGKQQTDTLRFIPTSILVGGLNHLEKYESQWEGLSHM